MLEYYIIQFLIIYLHSNLVIKKFYDYVIIDFTVKSINKDCKTFFLQNLFKKYSQYNIHFMFYRKKKKNILSLQHTIFFKDIL